MWYESPTLVVPGGPRRPEDATRPGGGRRPQPERPLAPPRGGPALSNPPPAPRASVSLRQGRGASVARAAARRKGHAGSPSPEGRRKSGRPRRPPTQGVTAGRSSRAVPSRWRKGIGHGSGGGGGRNAQRSTRRGAASGRRTEPRRAGILCAAAARRRIVSDRRTPTVRVTAAARRESLCLSLPDGSERRGGRGGDGGDARHLLAEHPARRREEGAPDADRPAAQRGQAQTAPEGPARLKHRHLVA